MVHKDPIARKEYRRQYDIKNRAATKANKRRYYLENREDFLSKRRLYYEKNREEIIAHECQKYRTDIKRRLSSNLRNRLNQALRRGSKSGSAVKDLGCSIQQLKFYLEGKFRDGMSWNNYGKWHIDHVIPLAFFDMTDREQFLKACHYTNLQPLWKQENLIKGRNSQRV